MEVLDKTGLQRFYDNLSSQLNIKADKTEITSLQAEFNQKIGDIESILSTIVEV